MKDQIRSIPIPPNMGNVGKSSLLMAADRCEELGDHETAAYLKGVVAFCDAFLPFNFVRNTPNRQAKTRESVIVKDILKTLRSINHHCWKQHGGPFDTAGLSDVHSVGLGRYYGFEVKKPGGKATKLQLAMIEKIKDAGGVAAVVHSVDEVLEIINSN